jgi:hypothetical protein
MLSLVRHDVSKRESNRPKHARRGRNPLNRNAAAPWSSCGADAEAHLREVIHDHIRSVVEKIRHQHPVLGRHFAAAINTGNFCAYQPDPDHPISWQL